MIKTVKYSVSQRKRFNEDDLFQRCHVYGTKKNSESPTGIEPMASQIPVGRSNQLSNDRLVVNWAIY